MFTSTMSAPMPARSAQHRPSLRVAAEDLDRYRPLPRCIPRTPACDRCLERGPPDDTISVTTRPQPPCRLTRRRRPCRSSRPSAPPRTDASSTEPIFICWSIRPHVRRVHFDADGLADQIDRRAKPRLLLFRTRRPITPVSGPCIRRPCLHESAGTDRGEIALDQTPDAVDLTLWDRRRLAFE